VVEGVAAEVICRSELASPVVFYRGGGSKAAVATSSQGEAGFGRPSCC
jgi:hypothetical protein